MLTRLAGGRIIDPMHGRDGPGDLWLRDGTIVAPPPGGAADVTRDCRGSVVMAGGIDLHSHIGGGKVTIARLLMADEHRENRQRAAGACRCGSGVVTPSVFTTGYAYARMGYTMAFEPAMLGANARQAHLEMADIPVIDKGAYVLLGSDDFLLELVAKGAGPDAVRDYVGWTLRATQALAVKVVNPGGIAAFKYNQRRLDLDEAAAPYGITPRAILTVLADALAELGVPHPLHVHGCNLGVPGNAATTLAMLAGVEGRRLHLTHLQFHSYGSDGPRGFSSAAAEVAAAVNANPNISIDVGQIVFGQTITASGDTMAQLRNARFAEPKRWVAMDIECDAGCGVVPFRYKDKAFVNALQWAIGLELFLLVTDPWRVALTTDHPNGGPFTAYPHLIRLLMDRDFRNERLMRLPKAAREATILGSIAREYTLAEIAILTRAGPARLLGIDSSHGHLGVGAAADVTVYADDATNRERMFEAPKLAFKDGQLIVEDGEIQEAAAASTGATHVVRPAFDAQIERRLAKDFADRRGMRLETFKLADDEIADGRGRLVEHACRR